MMDTATIKFHTRAANWDDIPAIVDLRNASSRDTRGTDNTAVHWQKRQWYDSEINLATDSLLVLDGEMAVAYIELVSQYPYILHEMVGVVHPGYRGVGIGTYLVGWAEDRVRKTVDQAPEEAAVFIQNSIFDCNQPGQNLIESQGFRAVRDFVYFQINLLQKFPDPIWPDGIEVRLLEPADWGKVGPALNEAFKDHWGVIDYEAGKPDKSDPEKEPDPRITDPEAYDSTYFNSPELCFVAWDGDQVAGSCLCNAKTVEFPEAGYIGSLSIRRPWRRRGIGYALTLHALNAFYERGTVHVLTDTDANSLTSAYRVYQKAGMEIFRREYVYEKLVRPGRDLVKRRMPTNQEGV